jgi:hypothetical protein
VSQEEGKFNKRNSTRREGNFFTLRLVSDAITEEELICISVTEQSDVTVFLNLFHLAAQ